jgi:hypothetical protein
MSGSLSLKTVLPAAAGLLLILAFMFIDWKRLLLKKELQLNFNIWRGSQNSA